MAEVRFETDAQLDKMLLSDKKMEAKVRNITRKVLQEARNRMRGRMSSVSTKEAYLAIRKSVYTKVLGGNINIATPRWKSGKSAPLPPESQRKKSRAIGGNRIPRSRRTEDLLTYWGADRGFIMRFLNSGTPRRDSNGVRYVGQIAARNWFSRMSQDELERTAQMFDELMTKLINEEFNKK